MLPRDKRLTKRDFEAHKPRTIYRGILFDVASIQNNKQAFACVISKKTLKKAVERNKARRRIYSNLSKVSASKQEGYIIYPKKEIVTTENTKILEELLKAFATL